MLVSALTAFAVAMQICPPVSAIVPQVTYKKYSWDSYEMKVTQVSVTTSSYTLLTSSLVSQNPNGLPGGTVTAVPA